MAALDREFQSIESLPRCYAPRAAFNRIGRGCSFLDTSTLGGLHEATGRPLCSRRFSISIVAVAASHVQPWQAASVAQRDFLLGNSGLGSKFRRSSGSSCRVGADMPPASSDPIQTDTPAGLRDLAARARRLAQELTDEAEAKRFIGIAEEMEAKAAALEARTQAERH